MKVNNTKAECLRFGKISVKSGKIPAAAKRAILSLHHEICIIRHTGLCTIPVHI